MKFNKHTLTTYSIWIDYSTFRVFAFLQDRQDVVLSSKFVSNNYINLSSLKSRC